MKLKIIKGDGREESTVTVEQAVTASNTSSGGRSLVWRGFLFVRVKRHMKFLGEIRDGWVITDFLLLKLAL